MKQPTLSSPPAWHNDASCAGTDYPDLFFPEYTANTHEALAVCHTCPVRLQCAEAAVDNREPFGVWGGTTEAERRRLRSRR